MAAPVVARRRGPRLVDRPCRPLIVAGQRHRRSCRRGAPTAASAAHRSAAPSAESRPTPAVRAAGVRGRVSRCRYRPWCVLPAATHILSEARQLVPSRPPDPAMNRRARHAPTRPSAWWRVRCSSRRRTLGDARARRRSRAWTSRTRARAHRRGRAVQLCHRDLRAGAATPLRRVGEDRRALLQVGHHRLDLVGAADQGDLLSDSWVRPAAGR